MCNGGEKEEMTGCLYRGDLFSDAERYNPVPAQLMITGFQLPGQDVGITAALIIRSFLLLGNSFFVGPEGMRWLAGANSATNSWEINQQLCRKAIDLDSNSIQWFIYQLRSCVGVRFVEQGIVQFWALVLFSSQNLWTNQDDFQEGTQKNQLVRNIIHA